MYILYSDTVAYIYNFTNLFILRLLGDFFNINKNYSSNETNANINTIYKTRYVYIYIYIIDVWYIFYYLLYIIYNIGRDVEYYKVSLYTRGKLPRLFEAYSMFSLNGLSRNSLRKYYYYDKPFMSVLHFGETKRAH